MKGAEISVLITQGRAYKSSSFLFKVLKNKPEKGESVAFITPKKAFKLAVARNKGRRRAKAAFSAVISENKPNIKDFSMLFMLNAAVLTVDLQELKVEIRQVLEKSGIITVS